MNPVSRAVRQADGAAADRDPPKREGPESLGRYVSAIHRLKMSHLDRELAGMGLGGGTYVYMMVLGRRDGIRQECLSREILKDKATTARAIQRLEQLGYVRREADPDDGRAQRVFLTEAGRELLPALRRVLRGVTDILADGFTPDERDAALELLRRMCHNMDDYRRRERLQER